ncbi:unnamed protein product [Haemonchus placei]|uniref:Transposase n=1 Tax=Haemonchus placei TaxID=6290 RepID=A0A0N4WEN4_HAEPC|nr:unnamed protein product [Haemonchus placei]
MTMPGRRKLDKQTWLWRNHVRDKVRGKKKQYNAFLIEKTVWQRYQLAKKETKKAVASEKAAHADLERNSSLVMVSGTFTGSLRPATARPGI